MKENETQAVKDKTKNRKNGGFDLFKSLKQTADQVGRLAAEAGDNIGKFASDPAGNLGKFAADASNNFGKFAADPAGSINKLATDATHNIGKTVNNLTHATQEMTTKSTQQILKTLDQNGDGKVDLEDMIILGLKTPGIRIDRAAFLQSELKLKLPQEVIAQAVAQNPMKAGIPSDLIDKVADEVVNYERNCVSGISALLGAPGGAAMAATIPADMIQYYGYMLRASQKLMYLYGFPSIDIDENGQILDSATMNILIICFGTMFGVANANKMLNVIATQLGKGVEKQLGTP
ncbi:hypothetical protein IM774_12385 [Erysipelotrichaceae bacterium RD49]|nr:hypothetical protein [Erysipelotrichaceae bacterium RD49]